MHACSAHTAWVYIILFLLQKAADWFAKYATQGFALCALGCRCCQFTDVARSWLINWRLISNMLYVKDTLQSLTAWPCSLTASKYICQINPHAKAWNNANLTASGSVYRGGHNFLRTVSVMPCQILFLLHHAVIQLRVSWQNCSAQQRCIKAVLSCAKHLDWFSQVIHEVVSHRWVMCLYYD